jgi:AmpE protein
MTFLAFLVLLIALLIERFFDWSHLRHWQWFGLLQRKIAERLPSKQPWLVLAAAVLPIMILTSLLSFLLVGVLYGVASLIFQLFILLYCLGPQNLWADAFACINAITKGDAKNASEKLKALFGIIDISSAQSMHKQLLDHIFIESNQRVFAVVFWFVALGPVGAVFYRLVALIAQERQTASPLVSEQAKKVEALLDWIPVRVFTFLFALGGQFSQVINYWRKKAIHCVHSNNALLTECGVAALGGDPDGAVANDGSAERDAISLLDRVFIIVLVIVLVIAMAG